jgi:hypothetical protein
MNVFSDISLWWIFPWVLIAVSISVLYYRGQKQLIDIESWKRYVLISLRSLALFLLGILLFGLLIEQKEIKTEKPVFITLTDNSESMLNYSDSNSVLSKINAFQKELKNRFKDKFEFQDYLIGSEISTGEISFSEMESNLDRGFDYLYNQYYNRNIGGICFISDGNFNIGKNPVYSAEKISLTPVFSVGVGDTILKRDQLIRNLSVNEVAFYKNKFPVEIDVEAHKMGIDQTTVSVWKGDRMLLSEQIDYTNGNLDFKHVSLMVEAADIGFVHYTVKVEHKTNESSYENNQRSFYVEIIDSRNKILILAKAPHPDLSVIRQVLDGDENSEVISKLVKDWNGTLEGYAMLIWHDPGIAGNQKIKEQIEKNKIPVLYILGNQSAGNLVDQLNLGLKYPRGTRIDEVQGNCNSSFQLFEISEQLKNALKEWPPLTVRFGEMNYSGGNVLISQKIGPVVKDDPILYFGKKSGVKYGAFIGEGLWRWKLSEYAKTKNNEGFNELIQKLTQYLTVKKNLDPLRVSLPKRFNIKDNITLNAEFYNSSFERITTPDISFVLKNHENDDIKYEFARNSKDYVLSLGKLKSGKYSWKARALFNGKIVEKQGEFVVQDVSLEALSTHANHNLLNQIAEKTNGTFYELSSIGEIFREIENRKDIVNVLYEESSFNDLIDWKWVFFLIVLLLTLEWLIRRYSGSY